MTTNIKRIIIMIIAATVFACGEDEKIKDPVYEFVSFRGSESINLNEKTNSEVAFPVVAQLLAFKPYQEDIELTLEIDGENAVENTDFTVTPSTTLRIPAGSLVSDTLLIKTIDNETGTDLERKITISIKSASKDNIKIGLGITDPKNATITAKILDDECSKAMDIYNASLTNAIDWGSGGTNLQATGAVTSSTVTVTGDLIGYSPFSSASLDITLTPASVGAMKGTATFGEQETGTDSDGYEYKFVEVGEGSYDLCSGTITVEYDIYYLDGGSWAYWYSVTNTFSVN
jgi:hypothetical protein